MAKYKPSKQVERILNPGGRIRPTLSARERLAREVVLAKTPHDSWEDIHRGWRNTVDEAMLSSATFAYEMLMKMIDKKMDRETIISYIQDQFKEWQIDGRSQATMLAGLHGHKRTQEALRAIGSPSTAAEHWEKCKPCAELAVYRFIVNLPKETSAGKAGDSS